MIYLAKDTSRVELDVGGEAVCVRHRDYQAPATGPGCTHLVWEDFAEQWRKVVAGRSLLVVVGISRIITPTNRVKLGQILMRPIDGVRRISVDRTLFVAEPWRMFWHFSCIRLPYQELTDSFLAETRWKQAQDGFREDPFSLANVVAGTSGHIRSYESAHFEPLTVETDEVSTAAREEYQAEKERAFEQEHTSAAIIKRLAAVAKLHCPRRSVPTKSALFSQNAHHIVKSDLAVDDYLVGELQSLVALTNGIANEFLQP